MAFALKLRNMPKATIDEKVQRGAAKVLMITHLLEAQAESPLRRPAATAWRSGLRHRARLRSASCSTSHCRTLDAKLRVEMRAEIKQITMSLNATTVYVTHDQEEAMTLGDRVVVMKDGITQQVGSALEIYNHPVNRFVASFLGSPPMTFFTGKPVGRGRSAIFRRRHGQIAGRGLGPL